MLQPFPFSFWKSVSAGFNPSTLSLDWYQRADYPGATIAWPGTASTGTSGIHSDTAGTATQGSTVNGHISLHSTGGTSSNGAETLDNYVTNTSISGAIMFNASTAPADAGIGSRVLNAPLMGATSGNCFGVTFSTAGVTVWILSSFIGYVEQTYACSTGAWHAFFFRYDGSNIISRLDNATFSAGSSVASGFNGTALSTVNWRIGANSFASTTATFDMLEGFLSKTQLSTTVSGDFDNYYSYLKSQYASAGLP